ncbi:MAG: GtrA family protein [Oxalicibacterium faecigallinarum]|uniref:GtrA family protein n=1 Tax=Oxalicibacterium faecigallinarum TaxID=573741 RepID=UPI002808B368|nr:GtrA family protein [Oxalicibacterium faecigallinarum]MDQ7969153.1 GtrA family protein [Oxalicibacterium faecigallinarum]
MKFEELWRIARFGVVGLTAAGVHYWTVIALVELLQIAPLHANVGGFVVAFWFSYFGHRYWTFSDTVGHQPGQRQSFLRFLLVAVLGFLMNAFLFFLFLHYTDIPYYVALAIVVLTVAAMTYVLSRLWAFRRIAS